MGPSAKSQGVASVAPAPGLSRHWVDRPTAVIDLGSNSARLVIYRSAPVGPPWSLHESKDYPRLIEGVEADGKLSKVARANALAALMRFRRILDEYGVLNVQAVATSAVRDASNGAEFAREVSRKCGFRLRLLSGAEEAQYAYLGVAASLSLDDNLIIDLGGGSLQAIGVSQGKLRQSISLPMGALRLHRRFLKHDPPRLRELDALDKHIEEQLEAIDAVRPTKKSTIIGVGGTTRSIAHALQGMREYPLNRVHGFTARTREFERLYDFLAERSSEVREEVPGLSSDRADIIVSGLAVVLGVLHRTRSDSITISGCGIREGIVQESIKRPLPASSLEMVRDGALATLWALKGDPHHAHRVSSAALHIFDQTVRRHWLGEEERLALELAGLLHDSGIVLSYPGHAIHSSHIIRNRILYGLSHRGIILAALAASMHDGDNLSDNAPRRYAEILEEGDEEVVRLLGSILAMAESVGDVRPAPKFRLRGKVLSVDLPSRLPFNPRLFGRASRWLRRSLEIEVDADFG